MDNKKSIADSFNEAFKEDIKEYSIKDYYADESRSFAIGFASWLTRHCIKVGNIWFLQEEKDLKQYSIKDLYDIYIKQLTV